MFKMIGKRNLAENIDEYTINAPLAARHACAGQFVMIRVSNDGERIPLTICRHDKKAGTVTVLVQTVGASTMELSRLNAGDSLADVAGPLGSATDLSAFQNVLLVGGGIGAAVILPQARQLFLSRQHCDAVVGAKSAKLVMYEDEIKQFAGQALIVTDDGSLGEKGTVLDGIKKLLSLGKKYDAVFAVGPLAMMQAVSNFTRELGLPTVVSLNALMVDGTGMCGCCRVSVGGKIKYACVDGPEFDGHAVDFSEMIYRAGFYSEQEKQHICNLKGNNYGA